MSAKEKFSQLPGLPELVNNLKSSIKFTLLELTSKIPNEIKQIQTPQEIVDVVDSMPYQKLSILKWHVSDLAYRQMGKNQELFETFVDLLGVVEDTEMTRIIDDPKADPSLKKIAYQYADRQKKQTLKEITTKPHS